MKKKGFTLVELLVVIAILAILATVSIVGYTGFIGKANESVCLQEATQIRDLIIAEDINNDAFSIEDDKIVFKSLTIEEDAEEEEIAAAKTEALIPANSEFAKDLDTLASGVKVDKDGNVTYTKGEYKATIVFNGKIEVTKN